MSKEFAINERVKVIGECHGVVTDRAFSEATNEFLYVLKSLSGKPLGKAFYRGQELESILPQVEYTVKFVCEDGVVIANLYKVEGDKTKIIARNHGHIFHDGMEGYVQACSYAMKRMNEAITDKNANLVPNTFKKRG